MMKYGLGNSSIYVWQKTVVMVSWGTINKSDDYE